MRRALSPTRPESFKGLSARRIVRSGVGIGRTALFLGACGVLAGCSWSLNNPAYLTSVMPDSVVHERAARAIPVESGVAEVQAAFDGMRMEHYQVNPGFPGCLKTWEYKVAPLGTKETAVVAPLLGSEISRLRLMPAYASSKAVFVRVDSDAKVREIEVATLDDRRSSAAWAIRYTMWIGAMFAWWYLS